MARLRRLPKPTRRTRKQHRLTPQCEEVFAGVLAAADAPDADEEKAFAPGAREARHEAPPVVTMKP